MNRVLRKPWLENIGDFLKIEHSINQVQDQVVRLAQVWLIDIGVEDIIVGLLESHSEEFSDNHFMHKGQRTIET